jgi:hypothetical protein
MPRMDTHMRIRVTWALPILLLLTVAVASAQPALPVKQLPPGFKVVAQSVSETAVTLEATRPNAAKPAIAVDTEVHLRFSWQLMPGFERTLDYMKAAPEEPASGQGSPRTEPAGKKLVAGGVLTFRKTTVLQIGTNAPPWVTYDGMWVGAVENGMLGVGVANYAGALSDIEPWIMALIPAGPSK